MSFGLVHSGGPVLLLFAPALAVLLLFNAGGPFGGMPEWLHSGFCLLAQFLAYFGIIHLIRLVMRGHTPHGV